MLAVVVDPVASLKIWSVDIITPTGTFTIPPLPANMWLITLYDNWGSLDRMMDLLKYSDRVRLEDAVLEGHLEDGQLLEALKDAITVAAGRPWWQAMNILNLARSDWPRLHGRALDGFDITRSSFGAYLDRIHFALVEHADPQKGRQKIDGYIETPPQGVQIELNEEEESGTFLAMLNQSR